ncbi:MAG: hypothetical protein IPJ85_00285 [Flavobacteriales bacterium]|nr:hypothetical protein [Flavobacteriales bacterium]
MNKHTFYLFAIILLAATACRKESRLTDDPVTLEFSEEEVLFDTVFALSPPIGTITKRFRVRNPSGSAVRVDIELEGGSPSPFRINVDGSPGLSFNDVEILGGDSIYVFVEATLDQSGQSTPLIHEDHIRFVNSGNEQRMKLLAWGQDAHYFRPNRYIPGLPRFSIIAGVDDQGSTICETVTWPNDKPYVIYGYAVVDSCSALIIEPGVRVHVHGGCGLWIYRWGKLRAEGTVESPITFQSDRLEALYAELPGQWDRIWINDGPGGGDHELKNVVIKNALVGLQCETWPGLPDAETSQAWMNLQNVRIRNCSAAGILSRNYRIRATNLLVGDCGQFALALTGGGQYQLDHVTVANFWSYGIRNDPSFVMTNTYAAINNTLQVRDIDESWLRNSIIHGANGNEFKLDFNSLATPNLRFQRTLFRTDQSTTGDFFPEQESIFRNQNPGFRDVSARDFRLTSSSFAVNRGSGALIPFNPLAGIDMDGVFRTDGQPDLGCYEFQP